MIRFLLKTPRSTYLFISTLVFIFISPLLIESEFAKFVRLFVYSFIFITTIFAIKDKSKILRYVLYSAVLLQFILFFSDNKAVAIGIFTITGIVFTFVTGLLIKQIARTKSISFEIMLEAISGYLLLGIVSTILNTIVLLFNHHALSINETGQWGEILYYSFITLTTIGYGDILPLSPMARNISVFTGIVGQLYLTIIIALIIGKLSSNQEHKK